MQRCQSGLSIGEATMHGYGVSDLGASLGGAAYGPSKPLPGNTTRRGDAVNRQTTPGPLHQRVSSQRNPDAQAIASRSLPRAR
jgi:hypothetical protein